MLRTYHFLFCHKSFYLKHRSLTLFIFYFYFYFYFLIILIMVYNLLLKHPRSSLLPSPKPCTQGISLSIISHSLLHFFFYQNLSAPQSFKAEIYLFQLRGWGSTKISSIKP